MNMANLNPKRTQRCNQSSLVGTLKGTTPRHRPSRYAAFGKRFKRTTPRHRPSDMRLSARILNGRLPPIHRPSTYAAFGKRFKRTNPSTPSFRYAAFGKNSKRTSPRHRRARYAAFGKRFKRTTPRHHLDDDDDVDDTWDQDRQIDR